MNEGLLQKFVAGVDKVFDVAEAATASLPDHGAKTDDRASVRSIASAASVGKLPAPRAPRFKVIEAIEDGVAIFVVTNGIDVAEAKTRPMADRLMVALNAEVGYETNQATVIETALVPVTARAAGGSP